MHLSPKHDTNSPVEKDVPKWCSQMMEIFCYFVSRSSEAYWNRVRKGPNFWISQSGFTECSKDIKFVHIAPDIITRLNYSPAQTSGKRAFTANFGALIIVRGQIELGSPPSVLPHHGSLGVKSVSVRKLILTGIPVTVPIPDTRKTQRKARLTSKWNLHDIRLSSRGTCTYEGLGSTPCTIRCPRCRSRSNSYAHGYTVREAPRQTSVRHQIEHTVDRSRKRAYSCLPSRLGCRKRFLCKKFCNAVTLHASPSCRLAWFRRKW